MSSVHDRPSILGMSCIREGPDTERMSAIEWQLVACLNSRVRLDYGTDVSIVGHMFHIGGIYAELADRFDGKVFYYSKKRHLRTETVVSRATWRSLEDAALFELVARLFAGAMNRIVAYAKRKRLNFDGEAFLRDVGLGIELFESKGGIGTQY